MSEALRHRCADSVLDGLHQVEQAVDWARRLNDHAAKQVDQRPDRFAAFAALPLQDPEAATTEIRRAVIDLGLVGALVNGFSQVGDENTVVYLDDPRYAEFWATVEELDVPVYLHPRDPLEVLDRQLLDGGPVGHGLGQPAGQLLDDGLSDAHSTPSSTRPLSEPGAHALVAAAPTGTPVSGRRPDGSLHLCLPYDIVSEVERTGWGELHHWRGPGGFPRPWSCCSGHATNRSWRSCGNWFSGATPSPATYS